LSRGAQALTDAELVAILVRVGFKGAKAAQLLAAMEIARRVAVPAQRSELVLKSTIGAAEYLRERMCGLSEEQFRVLYLNRRHALLEDVLIAQGSVESVRPSLRTIVARALQVNASALIAAFKTQIQHRTWGVEDVAEQMFQRLKSIDEESKDAEDREDRTSYAKTFPLETCGQIVRESLQRAMIKAGRITDENRQKFLQALGTLRRKSAKRVVYKLSPQALVALNTRARQAESCSAAELRRGTKTVFYTPGCAATLEEEQREFFREVEDPDGDFLAGRELVGNHSDFKTPANLVITDAMPERRFVRVRSASGTTRRS